MLEPIAIVYFPFITMIIFMQVHLINMFSTLFGQSFPHFVEYLISWVISKNLTKTITRISTELITRTTLLVEK